MTNKNYKAANYTVAIEVAKSPNDVSSHLINLKKWWPEDFEGEDIKFNSEFVFTTGDSHYSKNKVIEFVPDKKLVWLATAAIRKTDNYDWLNWLKIHRIINITNLFNFSFFNLASCI